MSKLLLLLAPLYLQVLVLHLLSGLLSRLLLRRLGRRPYLLLMFPGVIVHELAHAAACLLTRTRIIEIKLFAPHEESPGRLVLGSVTHVRPRSRLAAALIGMAPLLGGALVLRLLAPEVRWDWSEGFGPVFTPPLRFDRALTYVLLWLATAVAAHLAPSATDLRHASAGLAALFAGLAAVYGLAAFFSPAYAAVLLERFGQLFAPLSALLLAAITVTAGLVLLLGLISLLMRSLWIRTF